MQQPSCLSRFYFCYNFSSEFVKSKLERINSIDMLNDGTTDATTIEQEVLYVTFPNSDT